jgi:site-specific recombinase XerC
VRNGELHDYERTTKTAAGERGMTVSAIQQRVRFLGEVVELPTLSPHDARHYWATKATRNKNDLKTLQEAGGVHRISAHLRTYVT